MAEKHVLVFLYRGGFSIALLGIPSVIAFQIVTGSLTLNLLLSPDKPAR